MHETDLRLAERALTGEAAAAAEIAGRREALERIVAGFGARSRSEAEEVVADVLADCFGARTAGGARILEQYRGQCSLDSWLITVCRNRLRDRIGSAEECKVERGLERDLPAPERETAEPALVELLAEALAFGFSRLEPLELVFLRLVYLHGISQREVAAAWRCHESKVSRALKEGFARLREETLRFLGTREPLLELEWRDLVAVCEAEPRLLHGG